MKSSPDTEGIPDFTEEEVARAIKRMKRHNAQGMDRITSDIYKTGRGRREESGGGGGGGGGRDLGETNRPHLPNKRLQ